MTKLRAVSGWMTEDVAWMELLDLKDMGFHYTLEEKEQMTDEEVEELIEEYANYAKQEIRFCPYCGTALGIL